MHQLKNHGVYMKTHPIFDLVKKEKNYTQEIIKELLHIDTHHSYLQLGYNSLWDFVTQGLKYSNGAAHRRISAARLLKKHQEFIPLMETGELTLTNLAAAASVIKQNDLSPQEITQVLEIATETPKLKFSQELQDKMPEVKQPKLKIHFSVDQQTYKKWAHLKGILFQKGHKTEEQQINTLIDLAIQTLTPQVKRINLTRNKSLTPNKKQYIKQQDQHSCRKCGSRFMLEIDHKIPKSQSGTNQFINLRTLCRNCNQNRNFI
jgi:5-methylcytosine-specific restriction endonuclease McrA